MILHTQYESFWSEGWSLFIGTAQSWLPKIHSFDYPVTNNAWPLLRWGKLELPGKGLNRRLNRVSGKFIGAVNFIDGDIVLQVLPFLYSYQCPLLKGQSPKHLRNQQTRTIPLNPNRTGSGQYTQNYPLRDTTCKFLYILLFLIFWSLLRTQNLQ